MCHNLADNTFAFPNPVDEPTGLSGIPKHFPRYGGWAGLVKIAQSLAVKWEIEFETKDNLGELKIIFSDKGLEKSDQRLLWGLGRAITMISQHTCQFCGSNLKVKGVSDQETGKIHTLCRNCAPLLNHSPAGKKQPLLIEEALARLRRELLSRKIQINEYAPVGCLKTSE